MGAAGWYLAIDDIDKVLFSLDKNDGRILTAAQLAAMQVTLLGWDTNGLKWNLNGTSTSTSIALFGPGVFSALFMNSDVGGTGM